MPGSFGSIVTALTTWCMIEAMNTKSVFRASVVGVAAIAVLTGFVITQRGGSDAAPGPTTAPSPTAHVAVVNATAGKLQVLDATVKATTNDVAALYFTVKNDGPADVLLSASSDASPVATLHKTVDSGNAGTMVQIESLPIPANTTTLVSSGGYHVMLEQVPKPIVAGGSVHCTLVFKNAGTVSFDAPVTAYG